MSTRTELSKSNITLIGMPGAGKSTVGVILAKTLGMDFLDTDILIQNECKCTLQKIIDQQGIDAFVEIENRVLSGVQVQNTVIATGGSAVYGPEAMENLKKDSLVVYLDLSVQELSQRLSNIKTRGIAMKKGQTLESLFEERDVLYRKYADWVINTDGFDTEDTVSRIIDII